MHHAVSENSKSKNHLGKRSFQEFLSHDKSLFEENVGNIIQEEYNVTKQKPKAISLLERSADLFFDIEDEAKAGGDDLQNWLRTASLAYNVIEHGTKTLIYSFNCYESTGPTKKAPKQCKDNEEKLCLLTSLESILLKIHGVICIGDPNCDYGLSFFGTEVLRIAEELNFDGIGIKTRARDYYGDKDADHFLLTEAIEELSFSETS